MKTKNFFLVAFCFALLSVTSFAQESKTAPQIFLIGDSTMADKPLADNPERGWGQLLPIFFDKSVSIKNHAVNGRSTKSFIDEGRWNTVLSQLKKDDWVFIQFGHNDEKKEDPTRYAAPQTGYKNNLTRFVNDVRAKGANPILLTPVMRRRFDAQGKFFDTHEDYPAVVRSLAKDLKVPLIDLHRTTQTLIEDHGIEGSKQIFLHIAAGAYKSLPEGKIDDTHFSEYGAKKVAGLVVANLRSTFSPLAQYLLTVPTTALNQTVTVQVDKPGASISGHQFGVFFEDINFGADGGIYAELIKNRSFEFPDALMGWKKIDANAKGEMKILEHENAKNNLHFVRLKNDLNSSGFGIANNGFRGIGVAQNARYNFSVQARNISRKPINLRLELINASGQKIAQAAIKNISGDWKNYEAILKASATEPKATLNVIVESGNEVDLDMVSLFPQNTWKGRKNGLRADMVQLLAEMKPAFVRFPGGCIVEGRNIEERYQWKTTIGDPAERKLIVNRWNMEFLSRNPQRAASDYFQSFGLGFYEYFLLCEDIGAEPLPILNCGMACQFNSKELVPLNQLDPYIQDALDLIEFANGSILTKWGKVRAELGHPAPFNMKLLGVGNEQWGPQYIERYQEFAQVLKKKAPNVALVTSAGPSPAGELFKFLWEKLREQKADIIDEHYYQSPQWFYDNVHRYDNYPRTGPKVFAGEYAAHVSEKGRPDRPNNWEAALAEAALITGLERNADLVTMASYAPLFGNVDAWQWSPNLIWVDTLHSFGTPSYYVQKMFSLNQGTQILPVKINGEIKQEGLYASAVKDTRSNEVVVKLVNAGTNKNEVSLDLAGLSAIASSKAITLTAPELKAENSLSAPQKVAPTEQTLKITTSKFKYELPANSFVVLRFKLKN